jgi:hypothetical protein
MKYLSMVVSSASGIIKRSERGSLDHTAKGGGTKEKCVFFRKIFADPTIEKSKKFLQ